MEMAAAEAFAADVGTNPLDNPARAAAGVLLFQDQGLADCKGEQVEFCRHLRSGSFRVQFGGKAESGPGKPERQPPETRGWPA